MKNYLIGIIITFCIAAACFYGYWIYLDYKFEKNPQYYYKPRTIETYKE